MTKSEPTAGLADPSERGKSKSFVDSITVYVEGLQSFGFNVYIVMVGVLVCSHVIRTDVVTVVDFSI